jgi:hypothetical protein
MTEGAMLKWRPMIHVDQICIEHSKRNNALWCMFSRGVAFSLKGAQRIDVSAEMTKFTYRGFRYRFVTPKEAIDKVRAFDEGKRVDPFIVQLTELLSTSPVENRPPRDPYVATGKYRNEARKCYNGKRSRRWHGLKRKEKANA